MSPDYEGLSRLYSGTLYIQYSVLYTQEGSITPASIKLFLFCIAYHFSINSDSHLPVKENIS